MTKDMNVMAITELFWLIHDFMQMIAVNNEISSSAIKINAGAIKSFL